MRSQRGQATVEWIGIVLLVAMALAALGTFAPSADGRSLAATVLHSLTCAARHGCEHDDPGAHARVAPPGPATGPAERIHPPSPPQQAFTAPPLVPHAGALRPGVRLTLSHGRAPAHRTRGPSMRTLLRWARRHGAQALRWRGLPRGIGPLQPRGIAGRLRRGAGLAWRRAWLGCLAYERARYSLLHPESRIPGYTIPAPEALRIANDCISPVDLVRDWPLLRGR